MQNGFVESFNGRMRDEFLNETLFRNLAQSFIGARSMWEKIKGRLGGASTFINQVFDRGVKETRADLDSEAAHRINEQPAPVVAG
jgi:hypothetical protein